MSGLSNATIPEREVWSGSPAMADLVQTQELQQDTTKGFSDSEAMPQFDTLLDVGLFVAFYLAKVVSIIPSVLFWNFCAEMRGFTRWVLILPLNKLVSLPMMCMVCAIVCRL